MSPLLYVLLLEPFARKVRQDKEIIGVKLPGTSEQVKISLYADDSIGVCSTEKSIDCFFCHIYIEKLIDQNCCFKKNT